MYINSYCRGLLLVNCTLTILLFTRNLGPTTKNNVLEQKFDIGIDPKP